MNKIPQPLGTNVLIKPREIEKVTEGGIIITDSQVSKEQDIEQTGEIIAFGPLAFKRWKGCESPRWLENALDQMAKYKLDPATLNAHADYWKWDDSDYPAHKQWGIEVGDIIEHRRYNAVNSVFETDGGELYRYIPDIEIIGKINGVGNA